ncbi:25816_t:CDS:2 [Gigaspora margarita]|uniref:Mitochondrial import inner membrane translocase subunit n=1 Tax=Gigaspora margarita TaxID=4874 RepID=A0ABN7UTY7_GIGMA|nr:25816_t:CDS:2 [Gigaspora margarita]
MSFYPFGGGSSGGGSSQQQAVNAQNVAMAENELEMITDTFYRIVDSCYKKCIPPKYIEGELNKGESVCIDRCVAKYFEVNTKVGEALQKRGQQAGVGGAVTGFGA